MRIDRLTLENFRRFVRQEITLHPQFTLLIGENGAGKTTILDALAVAAGIWLATPPDSSLNNSRREILPKEIRLEVEERGDRRQFRERRPVVIRSEGRIGETPVSWVRQIRADGQRTSNADAREALELIEQIFDRDATGENVLCPVIAYYGAGRAWLPSNARKSKETSPGPARRWAAFYDCLEERIRLSDLQSWFRRESVERGNRGGHWRPGFDAVRYAVLRCLPDASDLWFDADRDQIVVTLSGATQPFDNLSAGQKMMVALVADLAIKTVTQNSFLIAPADGLPPVLAQTPGLVLIDELDVHLHPKWQRRVAADLKRTFPAIQFVCTSHSPQVIGELQPAEIRQLEDNHIYAPTHSFGVDSNLVLEELMDAPSRNADVTSQLHQLFHLIDTEDLDSASAVIAGLEAEIGADDPELVRARSLLKFLQAPL